MPKRKNARKTPSRSTPSNIHSDSSERSPEPSGSGLSRRKRARQSDGDIAFLSQFLSTHLALRNQHMLSGLSERFKETRIEISVDDLGTIPYSVCLINTQDAQLIGPRYRVIIAQKLPLTAEYKHKWTNINDKEAAKRMDFFMKVLGFYVEPLSFDGKTWRDPRYEAIVEMMKQDNSLNFSDAANAVVTGARAKEDISWQGAKGGKEGGENKDSEELGQGDRSDDIDNVQKFFWLKTMACKFVDSFRAAMVTNMYDSKGRYYVQTLLEIAAYICFGESYIDRVSVAGVGSSKCAQEGFRVATIHRGEVTSSPFRSRRPSRGGCSSRETSRETSLDHSREPSTEPSTEPSRESRKQDFIYTDCVVTSLEKGKVGMYLLVVEIKSGSEHGSETFQLKREMIRAGMHQTEIFGLVMNQKMGRLGKMTVHPDQKTVEFSLFSEFHFIRDDENGLTFDLESFRDFLTNVIALLDYGNINISTIDHFAVPAPLKEGSQT